ncbi:MAG: hypothetical protein AB8B72_08715 [Crocinitomicaceae bacterium]
MKYFNIISSCIFFALVSCQVSDNKNKSDTSKSYKELTSAKYDAVAINNQVSSIQKGIVKVVDSVFKSDTTTVNQKISDAIFDFDISISRLESIGKEHEVADYFGNSVIKLIEFYKSEFEGEFISVVKVLKKIEVNETEKNFLNEYDQSFANTEAVLFQDILVRQDSFAKYFSIGLTDKL